MAAKRLDNFMTWRSSHLRRLTTIAARCSIVTILFLAMPACQPPAPTSEKLQVERSALATPMLVQANWSTPQVPQDYVPVTYIGAQTLGNLNVVIVGWNDVTASVT